MHAFHPKCIECIVLRRIVLHSHKNRAKIEILSEILVPQLIRPYLSVPDATLFYAALKQKIDSQLTLLLGLPHHTYKMLSNFRSSIWRTARFLASSAAPTEQVLIEQLRVKFPKATDIAVVDVSGGCGAMFEVFIEAPDFKGVRIVKQHQLVNEALKSQIKEMHGLRISTAVSPDS